VPITDRRTGYVQQVDEEGLANWAARHQTAIRLLVRRGDYVFPGAPIALISRQVPDADSAIVDATALGETRGSAGDAEHAVRQLVEVAVRALSPGINDPHTAISVLDRMGATLCELTGRWLPTGVHLREGVLALVVPNIRYENLVNVMFHMIRQNAAGNVAVMIRLLDVLTAVVSCETEENRRTELMKHADLVLTDSRREISNQSDLENVANRHAIFVRMLEGGPVAAIGAIAR
jgi:uncharacterized membrane protein